jgi:hypothetical protein
MIELHLSECEWNLEVFYAQSYWSSPSRVYYENEENQERRQIHRLSIEGKSMLYKNDAICRLVIIEVGKDSHPNSDSNITSRFQGQAEIAYFKDAPTEIDIKILLSRKEINILTEQLKSYCFNPALKTSVKVGLIYSSEVKMGFLKETARIAISNLSISTSSLNGSHLGIEF